MLYSDMGSDFVTNRLMTSPWREVVFVYMVLEQMYKLTSKMPSKPQQHFREKVIFIERLLT